MDKKYIEHFFQTTAKMPQYEVFGIFLPIALIHKHSFNESERMLKQRYDLLHSDVDVLAALFFNGKQMLPTDLYKATLFSSGGMTKVLKKLQNRGFIFRQSDPDDRRNKLVCLETAGEEVVQECIRDLTAIKEKSLESLNDEEKEQLKTLLAKLTCSLF